MEAKQITVSQEGSGEYKTLQEAIDAVPVDSTSRTIIRVSPGVYEQPFLIPKGKNLITLVGSRPEHIVLTWHNTATKFEHHLDAEATGTGTFGSGSVIVEADDFIAENVTFENSSPEGSHQAVALRVSGERCAFYNCRFLGWQDTLYLHKGTQYLKDCYIEGDVDFIFGNSTALFEHCQLHCKSPGYITAHGRKTAEESTGHVFLRCVITGNGGPGYSHLGRPWGPFSRVLFAYTHIEHCVKSIGWDKWGDDGKEKTACFYEYKCSGPGCGRAERVDWSRELPDEEAEQYLKHEFIDSDPNKPWLAQKLGHKLPLSA